MFEDKIDFVILWVDGNDPNWLKEKESYMQLSNNNNINRFRDWENLQYLFRGIEQYANWVNKIYFVTWGHVPKWLNIKNSKLEIVKHEDFIPKSYLPTFNSNVIEMNLHRIPNLCEKFVLLNDDLFFLNKTKPNDFFKKGLPKDIYIEKQKKNPSQRHISIRQNYMDLINFYFNKKLQTKTNFFKHFNLTYGISNFYTLINLLKYTNYTDFVNVHLNKNFLKSTFKYVWNKEYPKLDLSCKNKFRANSDIGINLFRYWQLIKGDFIPSKSLGKYFSIKENNYKLLNTIKYKKYKIICINDDTVNVNYENIKIELNGAFENKFPNKCEYEL